MLENQCFVFLTNAVGLYSFLFIVMIALCLFSLLQGTIGFEQHIDKCLDLSQYLYNKIKNREGYEMVFDGVVSLSPFILYQGFCLSSQSLCFNMLQPAEGL